MAKTTGMGMTVSVDNSSGTPQAIGNDITACSWETLREEQLITGINMSAVERQQLLADYTTEMEGVFNPALSHLVWRDITSTSVARTVTKTVSSQVLAAELLFNKYALERGDDGALVWSVEGGLQSGLVPTWA